MIHSQAVAQTPLMYEQEWAGLLARIAAGDQPALAEFYDASSAKVFGLVMKILADRTVAEEVTMDVYTQVWRRASSYDAERGTPGSWLMTLAKTRAIDRFRSSYLERGGKSRSITRRRCRVTGPRPSNTVRGSNGSGWCRKPWRVSPPSSVRRLPWRTTGV